MVTNKTNFQKAVDILVANNVNPSEYENIINDERLSNKEKFEELKKILLNHKLNIPQRKKANLGLNLRQYFGVYICNLLIEKKQIMDNIEDSINLDDLKSKNPLDLTLDDISRLAKAKKKTTEIQRNKEIDKELAKLGITISDDFFKNKYYSKNISQINNILDKKLNKEESKK